MDKPVDAATALRARIARVLEVAGVPTGTYLLARNGRYRVGERIHDQHLVYIAEHLREWISDWKAQIESDRLRMEQALPLTDEEKE